MGIAMVIGMIQVFWTLQTITVVRSTSGDTVACDSAIDTPIRMMMQQEGRLNMNAAVTSTTTTPRSSKSSRCAINLYGLPRGFKDHVLPSLVEHVVKTNMPYRCDYFVHYYNKTEESSGRSGVGGSIDPGDVLLLKKAVEQVHQDNVHLQLDQEMPPRVDFVWDTDDDFWTARMDTLNYINNYPERHNTTKNPYYSDQSGYDNNTMVNILKMWHSQTRVFGLMEETAGKQQSLQYSRVAMLRLDVVYMTPIDIYKVPRDPAPEQYSVHNSAPGTSWKHPMKNPITRPDYYFYDADNKYVVIPGFASFPINDRMIMGPYEVIKFWATERWNLHQDYIQLITTVRSKAGLRKYGLHDERMLAHLLVPLMRQRFHVPIMIDRNLYFLRVRADGSIWVLDSPFVDSPAREADLLQKLLQRNCTSYRSQSNVSPWQAKCPVVADDNATKAS